MYGCTFIVKSGSLNLLETSGPVQACNGIALPFTFIVISSLTWGMWWRSWSRHCTTSRKVAGSIPDGIIGIFH